MAADDYHTHLCLYLQKKELPIPGTSAQGPLRKDVSALNESFSQQLEAQLPTDPPNCRDGPFKSITGCIATVRDDTLTVH